MRRRYELFGVFGFIWALWAPVMCGAAPLQVRMSPVRESYHLGEPIEVRLLISNKSDEEVRIAFQYPSDVGVSFSCRDDGATIVTPEPFNRRVPVLRLKAGDAYERIIALNRHVRLKKTKRYTIDFLPVYREQISNENPKPRTFSKKGSFTVRVEPGPLDEKRLREYVKVVEAKNTVELKMEEALEMLLWTDDPMVIKPIVRAAKRMPNYAHHVVQALEKFFGEDQAKSGILELAAHGNMRDLQAALRIYQDHKATLPTTFCKSVLSSRSSGKVYQMLEFLLKHGGVAHVPLVQPLEKHKNPQIQELASKVIANITQRKPDQDERRKKESR